MSDKTQRLVLSILDFLSASITDGTIKQDDKESIEIAVQCIGEAFGVDPANETQRERLSIKPATLQNIFDVYLRTKERVGLNQAQQATPPPAQAVNSPSAADKSAAENYKLSGNTQMSRKDYNGAIESYNKAIELDATNPVYYSNRAAAYSSKGEHSSAVIDAEKALELDPNFVKAYSRLGHAHYSLGDYSDAADAFSKGLALDPSNPNLKSGLENAKERSTSVPELDPTTATAASNNWADAMRAFGGAGGSGGDGMPDIASMMSNPAVMEAAQRMMGNGGMERLMQNPALNNMMNRLQSGGGMPSMAEIMADPTLREMAASMMGPGGLGRGGGTGPTGPSV